MIIDDLIDEALQKFTQPRDSLEPGAFGDFSEGDAFLRALENHADVSEGDAFFRDLASHAAQLDTSMLERAYNERGLRAKSHLGRLYPGLEIDSRFILEEELGEGTFGEAWRAVDKVLEGRQVVLKVLKAEWVGNQAIAGLLDRELRALAKIHHPYVLGVSWAGSYQDRPYIVTDYVNGQSLRKWIEERESAGERPTIVEALIVLSHICAGVEAAHEQGVIHRDLKPDNIMISPDRTLGWSVKVIDFGVALFPGISGTGTGTEPYMAPEQALGQGDRIGVGTDVFSLAVILLELLTGSPLLESKYCHSMSEDPWLRTVLIQRTGMPESICRMLEKALAPDPSQRPSAGEFHRKLETKWSESRVPAVAVSIYRDGKIRESRLLAQPMLKIGSDSELCGVVLADGDVKRVAASVEFHENRAKVISIGGARVETFEDNGSIEVGPFVVRFTIKEQYSRASFFAIQDATGVERLDDKVKFYCPVCDRRYVVRITNVNAQIVRCPHCVYLMRIPAVPESYPLS